MKQNCLSNTPFLPLLLVKVNASQSYTQYFIQEIHEIKTAQTAQTKDGVLGCVLNFQLEYP